MNKIYNSFQQVKAEALKNLLSLLQIHSISSEANCRQDMFSCVEFLEDLLTSNEFKTQRITTSSYPAVLAETGPEGKPSIIFYAHYDVQDAKITDGWSHDPFDPVIKDENIICRGASDDKGQLMAIIYGILTHKKAAGELPCRIRLLIDGAEEIGSPGLEEALVAQRETISSDIGVVADCGRLVAERPSIIKSLRGLAYLEIFLEGATTDLHSGSFGGTIDNPAQVMANMLSALKDEKRHVAVPGFYDDVAAPTREELEQLEEIPFDEKEYKKELGVTKLSGEEGYSTLANRWLRPTLDINGITAGFQGKGSKTVLPGKASCKLSCRLVPDQKPGKVLSQLEEFLRSITPSTCKISFKRYAEANPVKLDLQNRQTALFLKALKKAYGGAEPLVIREGATVPIISTFAHKLNTPPIPVGFGMVTDRAHGPDEKFSTVDLEKAILTVAYFLEEIRIQ